MLKKSAWKAAVPPACLFAVITWCALSFMKPLGKHVRQWLVQHMIHELEQRHGRHDTSGIMHPSAATGCNGMAKAIPSQSGRTQAQPVPVSRAPTSADGCWKQDAYNPSPRTGYLEWDDYFMALAFLSAQRSKDPSKQVGAVIVGANKVILGIGYNGFPRGCSDKSLPWSKKARSEDPLDTKYPYVVHAEANALLNKNAASVEGATVYVTMFPCNECAKLLIQAGIREVVFNEGKVQPDCGGLTQGCSQHNLNNKTQPSASPLRKSTATDGSMGMRPPHKGWGAAGSKLEQQNDGPVPDIPDHPASPHASASVQIPSTSASGPDLQAAAGCYVPGGAPPSAGIQGAGCAAAGESISPSSGQGVSTNGVVSPSERGQSNSEGGRGGAKAVEKSAMEASYRASLKLLTLAGVQLRQHCLARTVVLCGVDGA